MKATAIRKQLQFVVAMLVGIAIVIPSHLLAGENSPQMKTYKVKDSPMHLRFAGNLLVAETGDHRVDTITLSAIHDFSLEIHSETVRENFDRWAWDTHHAAEDKIRNAESSDEALGYFLGTPALILGVTLANFPFLPFKRSRHVVHIRTIENGGFRTYAYRLSRRDARALIAELRATAGLPMPDVARKQPRESEQRRAIPESCAGQLLNVDVRNAPAKYRCEIIRTGPYAGRARIMRTVDQHANATRPGAPTTAGQGKLSQQESVAGSESQPRCRALPPLQPGQTCRLASDKLVVTVPAGHARVGLVQPPAYSPETGRTNRQPD